MSDKNPVEKGKGGPFLKVTFKEGDKVQHSDFYSTDVTSYSIVTTSTSSTTTTTLPPEYTKELIETVDYAKSSKPYISRLKIALNWKGFEFEIERSPSMTTKSELIKKDD